MGKLVLPEVKAQDHTMAHNFGGSVPFLCSLSRDLSEELL